MNRPSRAAHHLHLPAGSEMGKLFLEKNWGSTSLGDPAQWPQSLVITLNILFNSKFPMFLWWGPDLLCFYNDAYRPSLGKEGKHPGILGTPAATAWTEIWHIIKPLIDKVVNEKESVWYEDLLVPIYRNGKIEDVYWTFSYSPVFGDSNQVEGVLVTCTETTAKLAVQRKLEDKTEEARSLVTQSPIPMVVLKGPEFMIEIANSAMLQRWKKTEEELVNRKFLDVFPHIRTERIPGLLEQVYRTGEKYRETETVSYLQDENGQRTFYVDFEYAPLRDANGQVTGIIAIVNDVTEKVEARKKIEENEQRFRLLADSMPQHIWTADPQGNLNYFNRSVFDYSGLTVQQIEKDGWLQIVHPDDREKNVAAWTESVSTGKDFLFEHRFRKHTGEYRWQLSRAVAQRNAKGDIQMWVGTSTDIQEIKELEDQKDLFIGMASHELKTPLTVIKGYVQVLQAEHEAGEDAFLKKALSVIDKQVMLLTNLVSDLLDLSKIKSDNLSFKKEIFPIGELITEISGEIEHIHPGYKILFTGMAEAHVLADRNRVGQVLINFLTNAIKYSPGSKEVHVSVTVQEEQVTVSVKDFGIGIGPADQQKIFERFYRVEGKNENRFPGFGIGLFIASEIIRKHDGQIGVQSEPGNGSVFYFTLPVAG